MNTPIYLPMKVAADKAALPFRVAADRAELSMTVSVKVGMNRAYEGAYEFTPSDAAQIIPIGGMAATQDITIKPIPHNYGLISVSGSGIRVS